MVAVVLGVPEAGALNIYCQMRVCLAVTRPEERTADAQVHVRVSHLLSHE